jgi:hypothetical protein
MTTTSDHVHDLPDTIAPDELSEMLKRGTPGPPDGGEVEPNLQAVGSASGRYTSRLPLGPIPLRVREELRLDVDGRHPQMVASGTIVGPLQPGVHWIANLQRTAPNTYGGSIWYRDGNAALLPHTEVSITVVRSPFPNLRRATAVFSGGGATAGTHSYVFASSAFHPVELEYDTVDGATAITSISTGDHPNRPASLPVEQLSIDTVYSRAGFAATVTDSANAIPLAAAGTDALWSDMEMHDAMQVHWSRFAGIAQWSVWTLFAFQHEPVPSLDITPQNLGGIMFDDIGPNHRQGTAVFSGSFINEPPPNDPNADAAVRRIKFWTAVHELGHTFNLAHSWQKSLGTPWIPLQDEPLVRSFMNYPFRVPGGATAFFADFEYRFSDAELLFMRHAPERFVQHGNADWFDDHGFREADVSPEPALALDVRVHREIQRHFEFLEPVVVELKLTNVSGRPQLVDDGVLTGGEALAVIVKREGRPARRWAPFARYCKADGVRALAPGESAYGSIFVSAGLNGWDMAEPGRYTVQVMLRHGDEDVVSDPLEIRIAPPLGYDEEFLAQDLFVDAVGRTLAFGGTRELDRANDTLLEVLDRFPDRRVADHARIALGNPLTRRYKLLTGVEEPQIAVLEPDPDEARRMLSSALVEEPATAAETLGHIGYAQRARQYSTFLADIGDNSDATRTLQVAEQTLSSRGVLPAVVADLAEKRKAVSRRKKS